MKNIDLCVIILCRKIRKFRRYIREFRRQISIGLNNSTENIFHQSAISCQNIASCKCDTVDT